MAITQKFYPNFFDALLDSGFGEGYLQISLFKTGATFDKAHLSIEDIPDYLALAITTSEQVLQISKALSIAHEKLYFDIPPVTWNAEDVPDPFRYAILYGNDGTLAMHIDFGVEQMPGVDFTLSLDSACKPYINLSYSPACT